MDGIEDKVGYIMIEKTSNPVGPYVGFVFKQVDSTLWWGLNLLSGRGSLIFSLNFSLNFGLLLTRLSKLHFFFSSHLILFVFGGFVGTFLDCLIGVGKARVEGGIVCGLRGGGERGGLVGCGGLIGSQVWGCGKTCEGG